VAAAPRPGVLPGPLCRSTASCGLSGSWGRADAAGGLCRCLAGRVGIVPIGRRAGLTGFRENAAGRFDNTADALAECLASASPWKGESINDHPLPENFCDEPKRPTPDQRGLRSRHSRMLSSADRGLGFLLRPKKAHGKVAIMPTATSCRLVPVSR
jgi:hypothetical protein